MALIAHLPLNGNTDDYSGNGLHGTPTNITYSAGKIGQAADFNGTNGYIQIASNSIFSHTSMSIAGWLKLDSSGSWMMVYKNGTGSYYIYGDSNAAGIWTIYGPTGARYDTSLGSLTIGVWYHIVCTFDSQTGRQATYKNGTLIDERNGVSHGAGSGDLTIGRYTSNYYTNGQINDIRIYDHVLSDMEVQQLARAKILHYTFDDMQEPTTNQADNDAKRTLFNHSSSTGTVMTSSDAPEKGPGWKKAIITARSTSNSRLAQFPYINHPINTTKTYSLEFDFGTTSGYHWRIDGYSAGGVNSIDGNKFSSVYSTTTNSGDLAIFLRHNITGVTGLNDIIYYRYYQVEEKPYATEFTEGSRTARVNDYSGFFNHSEPLTETTTPRWTPEAKIGTGTYVSNSDTLGIQSIAMNTPHNITQSLWFYPFYLPSEKPGIYQNIINESNDSLNVFLINTALQWKIIYSDETSSPRINIPETYINKNQWNHLVLTYDGATAKGYINGILRDTKVVNKPLKQYTNVNFNLFKDNTGYNTGFFGYIDDVRIYATAISDEDILGLYRNRVSFDNKGNVFNYHIEQDVYATKNLITNGYGELANNYNFPGWTYDPSFGGFSLTAGSSTLITSEFIKAIGNGIDTYDRYEISGEFRQPTGTMSRYYYFLSCYDKNKDRIQHRHARTITETNTFITEEVKNGDTYVTVSSTSNWYDNSIENYVHQKQMKWFPIGHEYPDYTYSRIITRYTHIDHVNNRIYLQTPWNLGTFPVNTKVTNTSDGADYSYIAADNTLMTENWVHKEGQTSNTQSLWDMRWGTEYIKVGWLMNIDAGGPVTTNIRNIKLENLDSDQTIPTKFEVKSTGSINPGLINQIDHNLNQETTKQRLKEDGTLEIDGYIIQN